MVNFKIPFLTERGEAGWLKLFKNFMTLLKKVHPSSQAIAFTLKNLMGHHKQQHKTIFSSLPELFGTVLSPAAKVSFRIVVLDH